MFEDLNRIISERELQLASNSLMKNANYVGALVREL